MDTPGVLSGEKQRIERAYNFVEICEWFAARCDLIFLLFDPYKLDISDEFKSVSGAVRGGGLGWGGVVGRVLGWWGVVGGVRGVGGLCFGMARGRRLEGGSHGVEGEP